jgi:hypothetical protein
MRCDSRLIAIALLTSVGSSNLRGEGGIVLEKPYSWSSAAEVVSVKEFSAVAVRGNFESGYNEYFIGSDGRRFAVKREIIAKVIFYPNVEKYTDIADEAQLSPVLADISELKDLAAKYQLAKPYLNRQIGKLEKEISLFRQGGAKIGGTWHSPEEMARKRQEAAELKAKLEAARIAEEERQAAIRADEEAARKAEEQRQAAIRADEERAAMERKAAAEAALASRVAGLKKDVADLLANTSLPASDFQDFRTLKDVKELPAATQEKIQRLTKKFASFGKRTTRIGLLRLVGRK